LTDFNKTWHEHAWSPDAVLLLSVTTVWRMRELVRSDANFICFSITNCIGWFVLKTYVVINLEKKSLLRWYVWSIQSNQVIGR